MKRREFIGLMGGTVSLPLVAWALKIWRIAHVIVGVSPELKRAFAHSLAEAGYEDGRNVILDHHYVEPLVPATEETIPKVIANVDLLAVWGTIGSVTAKKLVPDLPIVFMAVGDPVNTGLVESLSHPGGNLTGVTYEVATETWGKRVELLKEILPDLNRVAVLKAARNPNSTYAMKVLEQWGPQLKVAFWPIDVDTAEDLDDAFAEIARNQIRAVLVIGGSLTYVNHKRIGELTLKYRLPSCHNFRETVEAGGLASISPDFSEIAAIGARIVVKIIEGSNPRDIPVQEPTRYQVHLNLKTAKVLGQSRVWWSARLH